MTAVAAPSRCSLVGRYYDPQTGQFISVDPLVDKTEAPYAYVNGNPVDGTDPLGLGCFLGVCTHAFDPMASLDAIVNIGRGATFGLTDRIANWIEPGASCTVPQNALDQFIGNSATTLLGGEAFGALLRSSRAGDLLARFKSIDLADETGSINLGKLAARQRLSGFEATPEQFAAANRAIARATASTDIEVTLEGANVVVRLTRAGVNGRQVIETVVSPSGEKSVVQLGYDAAGILEHVDPKTP
jgi:hypothetical protein